MLPGQPEVTPGHEHAANREQYCQEQGIMVMHNTCYQQGELLSGTRNNGHEQHATNRENYCQEQGIMVMNNEHAINRENFCQEQGKMVMNMLPTGRTTVRNKE